MSKNNNCHDELSQKLGKAMVDGLQDYGRQTISALAQRDYDLGKFLFTASTFAIILSLTLVTALGKVYVFTLLSSIWFGQSVKTALKLATDGAGELDPDKDLLSDYEEMRKHVSKRVDDWYQQFNFGLKVFMLTFAFTTVLAVADSVYNLGITNKVSIHNEENDIGTLIDNIQSLMNDVKNELSTRNGN